jgi:hypothetical protein
MQTIGVFHQLKILSKTLFRTAVGEIFLLWELKKIISLYTYIESSPLFLILASVLIIVHYKLYYYVTKNPHYQIQLQFAGR